MRFLKQPLRIAIFSVHSCPVGNLGTKDTGGMSVYIRELARELGAIGHLVDIYTRVHDPADPVIISLGNNVRLIHLKAGPEKAIHKIAVYKDVPEFVANIRQYVRDTGLAYDVILGHYWISLIAAEMLKSELTVPTIATFHTLGFMKNRLAVGRQEPDLRLKAEIKAMRGATRIIATTQREKHEICRVSGIEPEKVGVVPCGINSRLFNIQSQLQARHKLGLNGKKIVLFVGRLDSVKGIGQLVQAKKYLQQNDARLIIVGGGENSHREHNELTTMARVAGVDETVGFAGTVAQTELPVYYNAADVCVMPSYYESYGLVALESLSCGTPVVATDVGELKGIIRGWPSGYIMADNRPETIAGNIDRVLLKSPLDYKTREEIRNSVAHLSWHHVAEKVLQQINLTLNAGY
ncbi:glycosyltransferase [Chloroflexota bacterium]